MTEEKIINRVKKMLALANDLAASEGERDNALRMAYNLMAKHNLDLAQVEMHGKKIDEPRIDFRNDSWGWSWARHCNHIIAKLFFCKYYYHERINGTQMGHHFVGRESNAMTAAVMADYVVNSILKEGRKIGKQNTSPITRSFCTGAMHALDARVNKIIADKQAEMSASQGTSIALASLYVLEQADNEKFLAEMVGEIKERKSRSTKVNADAYYSGQDFGDHINLNEQIGGAAKAPKQIK